MQCHAIKSHSTVHQKTYRIDSIDLFKFFHADANPKCLSIHHKIFMLSEKWLLNYRKRYVHCTLIYTLSSRMMKWWSVSIAHSRIIYVNLIEKSVVIHQSYRIFIHRPFQPASLLELESFNFTIDCVPMIKWNNLNAEISIDNRCSATNHCKLSLRTRTGIVCAPFIIIIIHWTIIYD